MTDQIDAFQARVRKISDPRNVSYYDPDLAMHIPKRLSKQVIAKAQVKRTGIAALVVSLVLGAVAFVISQLLTARFGMVYTDAPIVAYGSAAIFALLIGGMVNMKTMSHMSAQLIGIWLMFASMHNLVWLFPESFKTLYSPDFVAAIQASTMAGSLTFLGTTYIL